MKERALARSDYVVGTVRQGVGSSWRTGETPVARLRGSRQKNRTWLQQDGAYAFVKKVCLDLDQGSETLLNALAEIPGENSNGTFRQAHGHTEPGGS